MQVYVNMSSISEQIDGLMLMTQLAYQQRSHKVQLRRDITKNAV